MKKLFSILVLVSLAACNSGYLYLDAPELKFSDLEYGYPVKFVGDSPKIGYIEAGNPSAEKTLILVHGLASNLGYFKTIIPDLAKDYRVIAIDLPGYGHSEKGDFPYTLKWYAEQIRSVIHTLDLKNVYLSGHSMGGQIAMIFALNWPDEIKSLVLLSPAGIEPFRAGEGEWLSSVITIEGTVKTNEEQARINLSRNFYEWSDSYEWMVEERMRLAKSKKEFREFAYAVDRSVDAMISEPTTEFLSEIKVPVTFIYGKYDGLIPNLYLHPGFTSDVFKKGQEAIPGSKLIEIDNAGHMLMIEQPKAVVSAIKQAMN